MKKLYAILMALAIGCSYVTSTSASEVDEESIKSTLARLVRFRHPEMREHVEQGAFARCNYDTNRYVRLAKEVAVANTNSTWLMLLLIGKYGSTNDLDFISNYLRDDKAGRCATCAYFDIVGFSSNSVLASVEFMSEASEASMFKKTSEMDNLIHRFSQDIAPAHLRSYAYYAVLSFAANATNNICAIDRRILPFYPSYSNSVERLTILTNAVARGVNEYELRYLTNAIHHIELP